MTKKKRLITVLLLIAVLACSSLGVAAAVKKTVKHSYPTKVTKEANKASTTVKKGTTYLAFKGSYGYFKFKAPKTKTYTFTISNFKDTKYKGNKAANICIQKPKKNNKKALASCKVKTAGGKDATLRIAVNNYKDTYSTKKIDKYLSTRTAKIKLKKGEVIYFSLVEHHAGKPSCKLVIK